MLVIGVDAGGTRTRAALGNEHALLRVVEGEGANPAVLGVEICVERLALALDHLLAGESARAAVIGLAGAGPPGIRRRVLDELRLRCRSIAHLQIMDDARIALRSGVPQGDGIALISGTGSIAYAQCGRRSFTAGGYGFALGDDGSAFAIGRDALRAVGEYFDGRFSRNALIDATLQHIGVRERGELLDYVYAHPDRSARIALLAPTIIELAAGGDRGATKIVQAAALALGRLAMAVARSSALAESSVILLLCGRLLQENSLLTFLLETRLANELPLLSVKKNAEPAYLGALTLARAAALI